MEIIFKGIVKKHAFYGFIATVAFCVAGIRCGSSLTPSHSAAAAIPVAGEKIFVGLPLDSSDINALDGWPDDKSSQNLLLVNYRTMYENLLVEFRRSEKFGLYEIVEDSLAATTVISPVLMRSSLNKDTLTLPVCLTVKQRGSKKIMARIVPARGVYRARSKPKSPFHFLDALLADFCRTFPYKSAVGAFYPSKSAGDALPGRP